VRCGGWVVGCGLIRCTLLAFVRGVASAHTPLICDVRREQAVLQRHCAAYNGCCRIYAPKYQQARLGNYVVHGSDWASPDSWLSALVPIDMCALSKAEPSAPDHRTEVDAPAFNGAYEDVRSAFFYYLQHWNQGRPFILAGHSQGSQHLVRLIQELETLHETSVLLDRLVAAYLIGCAVRPALHDGWAEGSRKRKEPHKGCFSIGE
jgi:hypothetical protein